MHRSTQVALLVTTLALAACGGGGVDVNPAGPTPPPPSPTPSPTPGARSGDVSNITAGESQATADTAVATINAAVADLQSASAGPGGPSGAITLPIGATLTGTTPCTLSGNFTYTYNYDGATGAPQSWNYTYNDCRYGTETSYLRYNGSGEITYRNYTNAQNYGWTFVYDLDYAYVSPGYNYSGTLDYTQVCDAVNGNLSCSSQIGGNAISNLSVRTTGNIVTVSRATVRSSTVTVTFTDWVYDATLRRATSGTVVADFGNGNSITVVATGSGYRVTIVYNGRTTVYTVSY